MRNFKTHFEQVPLESIREMIEIQRIEIAGQAQGMQEDRFEVSILEAPKVMKDGHSS